MLFLILLSQATFREIVGGPSITEEVQHIALLDLNRALSMFVRQRCNDKTSEY